MLSLENAQNVHTITTTLERHLTPCTHPLGFCNLSVSLTPRPRRRLENNRSLFLPTHTLFLPSPTHSLTKPPLGTTVPKRDMERDQF